MAPPPLTLAHSPRRRRRLPSPGAAASPFSSRCSSLGEQPTAVDKEIQREPLLSRLLLLQRIIPQSPVLALRPVPLPGGAPYRRRYVFSSPTIDLRPPLRHPSPSHPSSSSRPGGSQTMAAAVRPDPRPPQLLAHQEKRRWQPLLPLSCDHSSSAPTPSSSSASSPRRGAARTN